MAAVRVAEENGLPAIWRARRATVPTLRRPDNPGNERDRVS